MRHLLALALLALALPSVGRAQDFEAVVASIDGETTAQEIIRGVNAAHCDSNAAIVFRLGNTASFPRNVDVWHSNGTDADCTTAADRSMDVAMRRCVHVGNFTVSNAELSFNVQDLAEGADRICSSDRLEHTFLFISETTMVTGEIMTPADTIGVIFDAQAPTPPTVDSTEVSGSGTAPIRWDAVDPDNNNQAMRYQVYEVEGGCGTTSDAGTTGGVSPQGGIVTGTSANVPAPGAYVVRTIDYSNNESADSEVVCVRDVPTVGFCDVREGGCPDGCSAGSTRAGSTAAVLVFLGLVLARRRKLV